MAADEPGQDKVDEAFLRSLYEGSDLLGKGRLEEAKVSLERALDLRSSDPKAKNLLGLTCFKLGEHERALSIYRGLIDDNPTDPTLRVNLGLVYLKSGRFEEAIRELATATDLNPEHRRAQNYLGLAYARVSDYAQARECFEAAGSEQMVDKMERALNGEPFDGTTVLGPAGPDGAPHPPEVPLAAEPRPVPPTVEAYPAEAPQAAAPVEVLPVEAPPAPPVEAAAPMEAPPAAAPVEAVPAPVERELETVDAPVPEDEPDTAEIPVPPSLASVEPLPVHQAYAVDDTYEPAGYDAQSPATAEPAPYALPLEPPAPLWRGPEDLLDAAQYASLDGIAAAPFAISDTVVVAQVSGELLSRLRGLLAAEGNIAFTPEVKRFRGRATDKPFGEDQGRMMRINGDGRLYLATGGRHFQALSLMRADGFFQEEAVFAFEEAVVYENGRVPSNLTSDLNLVHLRGEGAVLLETSGPMVTVRVDPERPVRVAMERLVGWHGPLTPRLIAYADAGGPRGGPLVGVELTGEGVAFLCLPAED